MAGPQNPQQPPEDISEEELRAAYEQQLKQVRVEDVLIQTIVSLLNLGGRKAGLAEGTEDERDPAQLRQAIEGVRVLLPLVEEVLGPDAKQLRDVLAQLQMAYTKLAPGGTAPAAGEPEPPADPGPPPPSGRIWVPGQ
jgi:hypothetical protein